MKSLTLAAIDIGSGSIKGILASKDLKSGEIEVLATSQSQCFGVRNGEIVSPEQAALGITKVKEDLSKGGESKIREVVANIGGAHLFSVHSQGLVSVSRADQTISKEDIQRALKEAETVSLKSNQEILEIFPREFIVDTEAGIKEPLGLRGIRLEVKALLACVFSPILDNLEKAIALSGLAYSDIFITPLASSRAILSQEQKELGVAVVDIGFSVTSLAVFDKGDLVDFAVFPVGSSHITNDLAIGLRTEIQAAESIKREFGTLKAKEKKPGSDKIKLLDKEVEFSRGFLKDVIESRVEEIFLEVQKALKKIIGSSQLPCGVILTGGGSLLPGIVDFTKQKMKLPCRLGEIKHFKGIEDSKFSTCCGLALLAFDNLGKNGGESVAMDRFGRKIKRLFKAFLP